MQKIELFQQTIDAWLNKDIKKLLIVLSEDILWTEYFVDNETGCFTWTFRCFYEGKEGILDGISLVKFSGNKICEIQEFEQKYEKFRPFLK